MRALILAPQVPWPIRQGTAVRNFHVARLLSTSHQITLVAFGAPPPPDSPLSASGVRVVTVPPPLPRSARRRLFDIFATPAPDLLCRLDSPTMTAAVARLITESLERHQPFEVLQIEGLEMARHGLAARDLQRQAGHSARLIYDAHNAEWLLQHRAWQADLRRLAGWPGAIYSLVQTAKLWRCERQLLGAVDATVAVSRADLGALRRLAPSARLIHVPNGVDAAYYTPADPDAAVPDQCAFVGKMDFRPNIDAMSWFCSAVWPRVRAGAPAARLAIVGRDPVPRVRRLQGNGIEITGMVPDVRPWLRQAGVVVVPLRVGGGTRLKVLEAMAMGKAIVATRLAVEGLNVINGENAVLADGPGEFAAAVLQLAADPARRKALGVRARETIEREYRWESLVPEIEALYRDARLPSSSRAHL